MRDGDEMEDGKNCGDVSKDIDGRLGNDSKSEIDCVREMELLIESVLKGDEVSWEAVGSAAFDLRQCVERNVGFHSI